MYLDLLKENIDLEYKAFNSKIINTNMPLLGVRTPIIKQIAKSIDKDNYIKYINKNKTYYEEFLLEGFIISKIKDYDLFLNYIDKYIDKIDNWALCDMVCASCKMFLKNKEKTLEFINKNINSKDEFRIRFGYIILLDFFIKEEYLDLIFNYALNDNNSFYYVMMAKAWLISICYIKYKDITYNYLLNTKINKEVFNKTISKICDSKRICNNEKEKLKELKKTKVFA